MTERSLLWQGDVLRRDQLAERLTAIVKSHKHGAAIAIQGQFGSGKTYFLTNLRDHLREQGLATVYFNAWESDYSENPLLILVSDIVSELEKLSPPETGARVREFAKDMLPTIARVAAKMVLRAGDDELDKLLGPVDEEVGTLLSDNRRSSAFGRRELQAAREALAGMLGAAHSERAEAFPLVVLVDELDRSNPSWVITFLESVKHLFGHQEIVFLIAIDRQSTEVLVRHRFGRDYDVTGYLAKFFNYAINVQTPVGDGLFLRGALNSTGLIEDKIFDASGDIHDSLSAAAQGCIFGLGGPSGQLRRLERCAEKIEVCARSAGKGVSATILGFLVGLSESDRNLMITYTSGIRGRETIDAIKLLAKRDDDRWLVDWTVAAGFSRQGWSHARNLVHVALGEDRVANVEQLLMQHTMMRTGSGESLASTTFQQIGWLL